MTNLKAIFAFIAAAALVVLGAFGIGSMRGRGKAEAKADKQRADEHSAAVKAASDRCVEVIKEARNVQQTISHMSDADVDRELRSDWTRKG